MPISLADAQSLIVARKLLIINEAIVADLRPWIVEPDRHRGKPTNSFRCRVRLSDAIPVGLWFRCTLWQDYPEVMTLQFERELPDTRAHLVLYRLEVKPHAGHVNGPKCSESFEGFYFDVGVTHEHSFLHNTGDPAAHVREDTSPCAILIQTEFTNFEEALQYVCGMLNVGNWRDLPPPSTQLVLV